MSNEDKGELFDVVYEVDGVQYEISRQGTLYFRGSADESWVTAFGEIPPEIEDKYERVKEAFRLAESGRAHQEQPIISRYPTLDSSLPLPTILILGL